MFKRVAITVVAAIALIAPQAAKAELKQIKDKSEFVQLVQGKTLSRPLVRLTVTADGNITSRGATWDVNGSWDWKDGFFCQDLNWGGCRHCTMMSGNSVTLGQSEGYGA